jgi:hypothetical protein
MDGQRNGHGTANRQTDRRMDGQVDTAQPPPPLSDLSQPVCLCCVHAGSPTKGVGSQATYSTVHSHVHASLNLKDTVSSIWHAEQEIWSVFVVHTSDHFTSDQGILQLPNGVQSIR